MDPNHPARMLYARDVIDERLQDLIKGPTATTSEAWHRLHFIGELGNWASFEREVRQAKRSITFDNSPIIGCTMDRTPRVRR
jgi:hypothetical protein